jgi:hypothetical protein
LSAVERDESDLRMASVFLWKQGRFKRFLHLIATKNKEGFPSYFEAAMQSPVDKILPQWQDYLNEVAAQRATIRFLPSSTICDDAMSFQTFTKAYGISLEQPLQSD